MFFAIGEISDIPNDVIGKTILSRDGKMEGVVTHVSFRYCAACRGDHSCYIVKWKNGTKTKPCTKGVKVLPDGRLQIN